MGPAEIEITADLSDALGWVLGAAPTAPEPVVVVAACLDALAKGYGLSESQMIVEDPLERADLPAPALEMLQSLLAAGGSEIDADALRNLLYTVFGQLAQDRDARRHLNSNQPLTEVGLLMVGQVYWNLEGTHDRPGLPIRPGKITKADRSGSRQVAADIPVPGVNMDFATMTWTARVNQKSRGKSSGQGFRNQGARLAVLAAQFLVGSHTWPLPDLDAAVLHHPPGGQGSPRVCSISWPGDQPPKATPAAARPEAAEAAQKPRSTRPDRPGEAQPAHSDTTRVLVGAPGEVGAGYQRRATDEEVEGLWADGGDRRIWLRGGPGLGKSYSARRVMQEAVADQSADHDELLIWVDSADAATVPEALSSAADRLRQQGVSVPGDSQDSAERRARALLGLLAVTTLRWLIVLDNADASSLIEAGLVPPGGNPNGRVLLTTRDPGHRIAGHGRVVTARLFTPREADEYLRNDAHLVGRSTGPLAAATHAQTSALAETVGHHPLALSVAASTIAANAMTVPDWIEEFTTAGALDTVADEPDTGGYPHLIGAAWQVALSRAGHGLPEGVVERAAMVAALQDPDGHPTWLWDRDSVADWVASGQTLTRRHGMPVAVQRLIDNGIVELRGGTWRGGHVAIHRLAARAVRELPDPAGLAQIAGILAKEWLLQLTANRSAAQPDVLHRSLRPIGALGDLLPTAARQTVTVLLGFRQPQPSRLFTRLTRERVDALEPYLRMGGASVRIELASTLLDLADQEATLGRPEQARTAYSRAADVYVQLVEDSSLHDDELASCLTSLGDIQVKLGNPAQSRAHWERAATLLERLADTTSDTDRISRYLSGLVTLHDLLGHQDRKAETLVRAEELLTRSPDDLASSAGLPEVLHQGRTWRILAELMEQAGRLDTAKECLSRAATVYEEFRDLGDLMDRQWAEVLQELALLHATTGEWSDAERLLARLTDISQIDPEDSTGEQDKFEHRRREALVLLASVQTHLGHRDDARQSMARAASQYPEHTTDDDDPFDFPLDVYDALSATMLHTSLEQALAASLAMNRWEEAQGLSGYLVDLAQRAADAAPGDTQAEEALAGAHLYKGAILYDQGAWDLAEADLARAVDIFHLLSELDPESTDTQRNLARALYWQARSLDRAGRAHEGLDAMTRSVSAYRRLFEQAPDDWEPAVNLTDSLTMLGLMELALGNRDEAVACQEESIPILSRLAAQSPDDDTAQIALADALLSLGRTQIPRPEVAVETLRRAKQIYLEVVVRQAPEEQETRVSLATTCMALYVALKEVDCLEEALRHLNEAVTDLRALADRAPDDRDLQSKLAQALGALGEQHAKSGRQQQAVDCLSRSANILQLLHDLNPDECPDTLILVLFSLAESLRDLGRTDEADQVDARARDLTDQYPDEDDQDS